MIGVRLLDDVWAASEIDLDGSSAGGLSDPFKRKLNI